MKKTIVTMLCLGVLAATTVRAQTNVIKFNILAPVVRTANVQYEKAIGENKSFQLGAFYTAFGPETLKYRGFGITPEFRFYLSDSPAPAGFYAAPFLRYQNITVEETLSGEEAKGSVGIIGGGLIIGKQWIFKEKVALDLFIGPSYYNSGDIKVDSGDASSLSLGSFDGFGVRAGVCFGLAF
jgi:hypothetical protein